MKIQRYITTSDRICGDGFTTAGCGDLIAEGTLYGRIAPGHPPLCMDCVLQEEMDSE